MKFIQLVFGGRLLILILVVALGLLTGGAHLGIFVELNEIIAKYTQEGKASPYLFLTVFLFLLIYMLLNRLLSKKMVNLSQEIIHDLRMKLIRSVQLVPYETIIQKKGLIDSAITKDTVILSQTALSSIYLITSAVTVLGCLLYLGFLSIIIVSIVLIAIILGISVYIFCSKKSNRHLQLARESEDRLFHQVKEILGGFREIKLNDRKGAELIEGRLKEASLDHYTHVRKGLYGYFNNSLIGQFLFYIMLIVILFFGGSVLNLTIPVLVKSVIIIIYLVGPLESVVLLVPNLVSGNIAAARLTELLDSITLAASAPQGESCNISTFEKLTIKNLLYDYSTSKQGIDNHFRLGPIDFEINKGEILFICGGNGSGKTTFFYILLGLLRNDTADISLNGIPVTNNYTMGRLFSAVFSDFHLFERLYGLENVSPERVSRYLELFQLTDKISYESGAFSTLDLSSGQKKRVALIAMLLENRPLLFLDEWAADQDPGFRKIFYTKILPQLKKEGFTIVAIVHDDQYYTSADAVYKMDSGKLFKCGNHEF